MITEKEQKIVDAVFYYGVDYDWGYYDTVIIWDGELDLCLLESFLFNLSDGQVYVPVCTKEEFNQCVKEMREFAGRDHLMAYLFIKRAPLTKENSDYSYYESKDNADETKEEQATEEVLTKIFDKKKTPWANLEEICESVQKSDPVEAFADVEPVVCASAIERDQIAEMIQFAAGNSDIPLTPLVELFEKMQKANMFKYF